MAVDTVVMLTVANRTNEDPQFTCLLNARRTGADSNDQDLARWNSRVLCQNNFQGNTDEKGDNCQGKLFLAHV